MSDINLLPLAVVRELENAGISKDNLIFHQNGRWVYQRELTFSNDNLLPSSPIDSLGPFDIHSVDVSFILYPERSEYTITKIGDHELEEGQRATGVFAPIASITLVGFARNTANIPDNATHFCWLYQPNNIQVDDDMNWGNSYELNLLKLGGFAYFKGDLNNPQALELLRVNSLVVSGENGLVFEGPYRWRSEFTEQMWNQKRFQPVTLPYLLKRGAKYFAFINPFESFTDRLHGEPWVPSRNGAFVYLFNEDHSANPQDCYFSVADHCLGMTPSDEKEQDA